MKYFVTTVIAVVALATIAGLWVAGSPKQERMRRFDEARVEALQNIQSQVVSFWQAKGTLPLKTAELHDALGRTFLPVDPETGAEYEYQKTADTAFRLCAQFSTSSTEQFGGRYKEPYALYPMPYGAKGDSWEHSIGRVCFDRTIDKDFFRPQKID